MVLEWFLNSFLCFGDADFAYPKVMYLSFYWGISAHLLTVLYQMMLRRIQEYGSLGVLREMSMVLGQFLNSFSLFLGCFSKVMHLGFSLAISTHLLTVLYPMMLESDEQYGGLCVNWLL